MAELKDAWVKTAKSFVLATNDLVSALSESAKAGRKKVIDWAESETGRVTAEGTEIPTEGTEIPTEDSDSPTEDTADTTAE